MAKITEKEFEAKVLDLAKQGMTSEKIGQNLKKEKVYSKDYKKIGKILKENSMYKSADIENIGKRVKILQAHSTKHIQDRTYKRALDIQAAKLRKLNSLQ